MWIVELALRRPYTMLVMALLILVLGLTTIRTTAVDLFPRIQIPVVAAIWSYPGLPAEQMEQYVCYNSERIYSALVNNVDHQESNSLFGASVIKLFLDPGSDVATAVAQTTSASLQVMNHMPPGTVAPEVLVYSAADVPVLSIIVSSETAGETELMDLATNIIRPQLSTIDGVQLGFPYGGKSPQVMVDLDQNALYSAGLSPQDVLASLLAQNVVLPSGTVKIGPTEYYVFLNNSPLNAETINDVPIKTVNGATVFFRDVGHVRQGSAVQTNIVTVNGKRAVMLSLRKAGDGSTLDVVNNVLKALPHVRTTVPPNIRIEPMFDQSVFVREAVNGVVKEAIIAAGLTSIMILLFLGSWRSTLIIAISIPLSILTSIIVLRLFGQTLNTMTLGGMALAVGILVDDATVAIENCERHLHMGKGLQQAILDGSRQIAVPALVSTLSICIVFAPIFALGGTMTGSLFMPLAMSVVFAMLASYVLSRSLVPTLMNYLLGYEARQIQAEQENPHAGHKHGFFGAIQRGFEHGFARLTQGYGNLLQTAINHKVGTGVAFFLLLLSAVPMVPWLGRDYFPKVSSPAIRLHVRCPAGTRIEETARSFGEIEETIRGIIPPGEIGDVVANIGLPISAMNLALTDAATIGSLDGEIDIALKDQTRTTDEYTQMLREKLPALFPEITFFTQPADMVGQVLNAGAPTPIGVSVRGTQVHSDENLATARQLMEKMRAIPGCVDVHLSEVINGPRLQFDVDRTKALQVGMRQLDVGNSVLVALSSSSTVSPNWWVNPKNGIDYLVAAQTPQYNLDTLAELKNTPIQVAGYPDKAQFLSNLGTLSRGPTMVNVAHYNIQRTYTVQANTYNRDLGGVAADINKAIDEVKPTLARGSTIGIHGQIEGMNSAFIGLSAGMLFSILLVYFLIVVNFQSWLSPFIILMAVPFALVGLVWMLFLAQTPVSVPALMGAIMVVGLTAANSILVINFANEKVEEGQPPAAAAWMAGTTRIRPVIMTTLAMILGMLPMSLGLGDGGEQNAPLGRAVIGGLIIGPWATLIFVPMMYSWMARSKAYAGPPGQEVAHA